MTPNKIILFSLLISFSLFECSNYNSDRIKSKDSVTKTSLKTLKKYKDSNNYCHCAFSVEKEKKFFLIRDSIAQDLLKKNDSVIVVGLHAAGGKNGFEKLLFIGNTRTDDFLIYYAHDSLAKTPFYNARTKSHLWQGILLNLDSLKTTYDMKADNVAYDAPVFTITLITNTEKIDGCICYAQLASNKSNPLTDLVAFFNKEVIYQNYQ